MKMSKVSCELCSLPATTYCESDQAKLCYNCDSKVHKANFLVNKHSRTLLCHLCQNTTPWSASGPMLPPCLSLCVACATPDNNNANNVHAHAHSSLADHLPRTHHHDDHDDGCDSYDDDHDEEHDDDDDDDDDDDSHMGHDDVDDKDEEDEDEDNQVVPLTSSFSSSPISSSSNTDVVVGSLNSSSNEIVHDDDDHDHDHDGDDDDDDDIHDGDGDGNGGYGSSRLLSSSLKRKREFYLLS